MRRILFFLSITFFVSAAQVNAQQKSAATTVKQGVYRDGVARLNGEMVLLRNGQAEPLAKTVTLPDGTTVSADGKVTSADGKTSMLKEGMAVNQQGRIVIFKDDMFMPEQIRRTAQGHYQETEIIEQPDTIIIRKK